MVSGIFVGVLTGMASFFYFGGYSPDQSSIEVFGEFLIGALPGVGLSIMGFILEKKYSASGDSS